MLIDGLNMTTGSTAVGVVLEAGTSFPTSPIDGQGFRLTATVGNNAPGVYWYAAAGTVWVSGDITSVSVGVGLLGGGTSGDITVGIDPAYIPAGPVGPQGPAGTAGTTAYDIAGQIVGKPAASAVVLRFGAVRAFTLPAGLTGSIAKTVTVATASTVLSIQKNGSQVGTLTFAGAATTAVRAFASAVSFAAGDILTVVAPSSADATFGDAFFTLAGTAT